MSVRARVSARLAAFTMTLAGLPACGKPGEAVADAHIEVDPAATAPSERDPRAAPADAHPETTPRPVAQKAVSGAPRASASAPPPAIHPLAVWMRGPATRAVESGDLEAIARAFEQMVPWAPTGYANWSSIALDGSQAARAGSIDGVRAACRGCHAQYETQYRSSLSTRPLS